jgi:glutamate synthase (NADPH/NADH) small chain
MGKPTGFLEVERLERGYKPVEERTKHWKEFVVPLGEEGTKAQAARCMDCGIPFATMAVRSTTRSPTGTTSSINGDWKTAILNLHSTNNFPEMTGRICPAPCEASCTLNIEDVRRSRSRRSNAPSPIAPGRKAGSSRSRRKENRQTRCHRWLRPGWHGRGPAAWRAGHDVHVFEKNARPGGLMVYGIPDFKMEKKVIDRRVRQMEAEGVTFHCNVHIGKTRRSKA